MIRPVRNPMVGVCFAYVELRPCLCFGLLQHLKAGEMWSNVLFAGPQRFVARDK